MAIDSAAKRKGASSVGWPWMVPGITPDATAGSGWRQTAAWGWYGVTVVDILFDWPVAITLQAKPIFTLQPKPTFTRS